MASDSESDDDEQEVLAMRARIAAKKEEQERERARTMMQDKRSHEQTPIFSTKLLSNHPPLEGRGSYTFEDGSHYDGEWMNFLPHGEGIYTWPSGTVYKGSFSAGSVHGIGVLTKRNIGVLPYSERGPGKVEVKYEGSFLNGSADGPGLITFPLDENRTNRDEVPTKFEGSFWNNTAQGDGCFTNPCSTETGKWHAGKYVLGTGARRSAGTRAAPGVTRPRPVEVEVELQEQQEGKRQGIEVWGAAVFHYFDANHDGKLSSVELARALKSLPKTKPQKCPPGTKFQTVEDMINAMDADQNGYVEESEWVENLSKCPGLYAALAEYTDENGELPTFLSYEELLARRKKELAELQAKQTRTAEDDEHLATCKTKIHHLQSKIDEAVRSTRKLETWGSKMFHRFDRNNDGKLSKSELANALKVVPKDKKTKNVTPDSKFSSVDAMFLEMDSDMSGYIDEQEWLANLSKCAGLAAALSNAIDDEGEWQLFMRAPT